MLKTIKSKIIFITLLMLAVLSVITSVFAYNSYVVNRILKSEGCDLEVGYFAEQVNKDIKQLQENAVDLALSGEVFYNSVMIGHSLLDLAVKRNFENNELAIGGGLWFEPFMIMPAQERFCTYAFHSDKGVVIDKSFEGVEYDYLTQHWYTEIKAGLKDGRKAVWTIPYFDGTGTRSLMTTVGAGIYNRGELIGMSTVDWKLDSIVEKISEIRQTKNSFALFADKENDFILAITDKKLKEDMVGKPLSAISWYNDKIKNGKTFNYKGEKYISFVRALDNRMILVVNVPTTELFAVIWHHFVIMFILLLITCCAIAASTYYVLQRNITKPINYLTKTAKKIGEGNLDIEMQIEEPEEFAHLAGSFNKMKKDIQDYVKHLSIANAEKEKMESELEIAKSIQNSFLPNSFPPYPDHNEFEIFAKMTTAKEVGGDFYDFFFVDPDHFAYLIADVSGKGIPAALFMMTTKTLIKNLARADLAPEQFMMKVNHNICKTNEQGFFVTAFVCVTELSTGKTVCINAGHNPPLLKRADGEFEYLRFKPNLVLGAVDCTLYQSEEFTMKVGDTIFMYTDGVTEACNSDKELYGEERLKQRVNGYVGGTIYEVLDGVKSGVDEFEGEEEQADDLTMLIFRYNGLKEQKMENKEIKEAKREVTTFLLPADTSRWETVSKWLEEVCDEAGIPTNYKMKLALAVEEVFVNISNYAYPPKDGDVEISFKVNNGKQVEVQFADSGTPYNPLEKPDPDITLSAEERPVGGLGIFIVKQSMDSMDYEYKNGKNVLTIKMTFS